LARKKRLHPLAADHVLVFNHTHAITSTIIPIQLG
jgi:hypothetical protein